MNFEDMGRAETACCEPVREPSVQSRLTNIKESLGEASAVLEGVLNALHGGGEDKCAGEAPIPISCVMDDLAVTSKMAEYVLMLARKVSAPLQG